MDFPNATRPEFTDIEGRTLITTGPSKRLSSNKLDENPVMTNQPAIYKNDSAFKFANYQFDRSEKSDATSSIDGFRKKDKANTSLN